MGFFKRLFGGADPDSRDAEADLREARPPLDRPVPAFAFPIESCAGATAVQWLDQYRAKAQREGATAVLIGDDEDLANLDESRELHQGSGRIAWR